MTTGYFELREDEDTGRRYWFGAEDGWKDATEVGEDGTLTLSVAHFNVGAVLRFSEPDEGTLSYGDIYWKWRNAVDGLKLWMVGWRDDLKPEARTQLEGLIKEYDK